MCFRKLVVSFFLSWSMLTGVSLAAAPEIKVAPEVKVNIDVVQIMRELASWISAGFGRWEESRKEKARNSALIIAKDLLELASVKESLSRKLDLISDNARELIGSELIIEDRGGDSYYGRRLIDAAQSDARKLSEILTRIQENMASIDPIWSKNNLKTQTAMFDMAQGYGNLIIEVDVVNRSVRTGRDQSFLSKKEKVSELSRELISEAKKLRELSDIIANAKY